MTGIRDPELQPKTRLAIRTLQRRRLGAADLEQTSEEIVRVRTRLNQRAKGGDAQSVAA